MQSFSPSLSLPPSLSLSCRAGMEGDLLTRLKETSFSLKSELTWMLTLKYIPLKDEHSKLYVPFLVGNGVSGEGLGAMATMF